MMLRTPVSTLVKQASTPKLTRSLFGFSTKKKQDVLNTKPPAPIIGQDDLFHPLSKSPFKEMRAKGERIKAQAFCPVTLEKYNEKVHVAYECPDCGFPTHASEERWKEDTERARYWPKIREANEDEHDLRSGREMTEFALPGEQPYEEAVSMGNWDVFLYTRGFNSIDTERSRRHVSKLLTYPLSIASVIHENSPYTLRNSRLLPEGLRSLVALRQALHPAPATSDRFSRPPVPVRIFVVGARAESSLPPHVLQQLSHVFPRVPLHVFFVGPEAILPPQSRTSTEVYGVPSHTAIVSDNLTLTTLLCPYEEIHDSLGPFDPYLDVFFAFSPGFGFPSETEEGKTQLETNWLRSVLQILETKCALFCTGFSPVDLERDIVALDKSEGIKGEFDWLLTPGENIFGSEKWEVAEFDPRVTVKTNWGLYGIRGKRYEVREDGH
ncbi:hypothetical protein T439DRAFT_322786 [Meredithblackwellia eburnea MCA 4105]